MSSRLGAFSIAPGRAGPRSFEVCMVEHSGFLHPSSGSTHHLVASGNVTSGYRFVTSILGEHWLFFVCMYIPPRLGSEHALHTNTRSVGERRFLVSSDFFLLSSIGYPAWPRANIAVESRDALSEWLMTCDLYARFPLRRPAPTEGRKGEENT
jgi:hypothetical protein